MVVPKAVDSTAKEMSQYAYYYGISGLQGLADTLDANGQVVHNTTNEFWKCKSKRKSDKDSSFAVAANI